MIPFDSEEFTEPQYEPFGEVSQYSIEAMIRTPAPQHKWLIEGFLLEKVTALLAGAGGTGKSFLTLQMAFALASGQPFLGLPTGSPKRVLMLNAEDPYDEAHRRVQAIVNEARRSGCMEAWHEDLLIRNIAYMPFEGMDCAIAKMDKNGPVATDFVKRLQSTWRGHQWDLIVMDPIAMFREGDENSNDQLSFFIREAKALRQAMDCTVLLVHHFNKSGMSAGAGELTGASVRGGSALISGVRSAIAMQTMQKSEAKAFGLDPSENPKKYVRIEGVKANWGPQWDGMWLERGEGGVLLPSRALNFADLDTKRAVRSATLGDMIFAEIERAEANGERHTRRSIQDASGLNGIFRASRAEVFDALGHLIGSGRVVEKGGKKGGMALGLPE